MSRKPSRGSASFRGTVRNSTTRFYEVVSPAHPQPSGELLETLAVDDLPELESVSKIQNTQLVASYNWLDGKSPSILVPGSPPSWSPLPEPRKLKQDRGDYYRDPNAARSPQYPMEPAIRSVLSLHEDFETSSINIVGCSSTIGNILRYAGSLSASFSFDVDVIGNTIFFVRKEASPTQVMEGVYGYGHTFPEAYTNWESESRGSVSHQRIISYSFGSLNCLVRFESDGYIKDKLTLKEREDLDQRPDPAGKEDEEAIIVSATQSISVSEQLPTETGNLQITRKGSLIPQKAVFDIKTRSRRSFINMDEIRRRMWVNQTPNFILGYYTHGVFDEIEIMDIKDELVEWETQNQETLGRLEWTLKRIIEIARESGGQSLQLTRFKDGALKIHKHEDATWRALPPDLQRRWAPPPEKPLSAGPGPVATTEDEEDLISFL
ncbi:MAG: hypothetical protein M4579_001812 [Chaenotheca gracillima]|nr:MAG: hypothetical protein M4579_001812 [Chaenotheca gracillima]